MGRSHNRTIMTYGLYRIVPHTTNRSESYNAMSEIATPAKKDLS